MVQSQSSNDLGAQVCRNITVAGRRTSIRMEMVFWSELQRIAEMEKRPLSDLVTMIDGRRGTSNLTAALRVFIVCYIRALRVDTKPPTGEQQSDESKMEEHPEDPDGGGGGGDPSPHQAAGRRPSPARPSPAHPSMGAARI
jgi:predicted DNA-binding ribbon-helix-helix protein